MNWTWTDLFAENKKIETNAMVSFLQKTDRYLLENEKVIVDISNDDRAPASCDPMNFRIWINLNNIYDAVQKKTKDLDKQDFLYILSAKGANFHEDAHLIYTDFSEGAIKDRMRSIENSVRVTGNINKKDAFYTEITQVVAVKDKKNVTRLIHTITIDGIGQVTVDLDDCMLPSHIMEKLNILEDGRIETFISAQYPNIQKYLIAVLDTVLKFDDSVFQAHDDEWKKSNFVYQYLLVYGRKYLNQYQEFSDKIARFRENLIAKGIASDSDLKKFEFIVDSYINEVSMNKRIFWAVVLEWLSAHLFKDTGSMHGSIKSIPAYSMSDDKAEDTRKALNKMKNQGMSLPLPQNPNSKEKDDKEENSSGGSGSGSGSGDEKKKKKYSNSKVMKDMKKIIENIIEESRSMTEQDNEITKEVHKDIKALKGGDAEFDDIAGEQLVIGNEEKANSARLVNVLKRLRGDLSTQFRRHQNNGRIDPTSVMSAKQSGTTDIFSNLKLNKVDKVKMAVSILLDVSGSIHESIFNQEAKSGWCLVDALQKLGHCVEVLEFGSYLHVVKDFKGQGDWKRKEDNGGTKIALPIFRAIKDIDEIAKREKAHNKLIIVVSDGVFHDKPTEALEKAKKDGIETVWILVGQKCGDKWKDQFTHRISINDFSELPKELSCIVEGMQKRIITNLNKRGYL